MDFTQEYGARKEKFEAVLKRVLGSRGNLPSPLKEAVEYSLLCGGKRLRPLLLTEAYEALGGSEKNCVEKFAVAIECIHVYSLIHDDLPCMDDDDFRRGQPTCHKKFGEANAVLAGDALLNLAYELIFEAIKSSGNDGKVVAAGSIIAEAAGGTKLIGGQAVDLNLSADSDSIDYIYKNKTGALIKASLVAGAVLAGADSSVIDKISEFGDSFGYCFQLRDDLLDKDTDSADKNTFLNVYGEEKTIEELQTRSRRAVEILSGLSNNEFLTALTENFVTRNE